MSSLLGEIGLSEQLLLSYIIGIAGAPAVYPGVRSLENLAWQANPVMPPDAMTMALGVAQGQVDPATASSFAQESGFGADQFKALVAVANVGPGSAFAFEMWRRGQIDEAGFRRAVKRLGWEQEWIDDAVKIKDVLLTPAELAVMIQRTVVANPGILPNQPSTAGSNVPPMPQVNIDPVAEASGAGISEERLAAMARIIGLPASPDLAARMHFRKIITLGAYNQAILEGNTRGEWAPFLLDGFRQIPTAEQFVEAHLRGWITKQDMYDGTALHGMSQPNTDLEFQIHRRPMTVRQITQALAWGGNFNPEAGEIQDPYDASVHQLNLGPEWYGLAKALKHTYSVPFWWRSMTQTGDLGPQEAETILLRLGNPPAFAKTTTAHFAGGTTAAADPHVTKAHNTAWTKAQSSYIARESTAADVQPIFTLLGVPTAAQAEITQTWNAIRALVRAQLTPAQIKKALREGITNPATGQPWTMQEAIDALLARGYDRADATVLLEE